MGKDPVGLWQMLLAKQQDTIKENHYNNINHKLPEALMGARKFHLVDT